MKKVLSFYALVFVSACLFPLALTAQVSLDTELIRARNARDRAAVPDLQKSVAAAKRRAIRAKTAESYVRLALLQTWLCEAAESTNNMALFKKTVKEGVSAAEKAVTLDPNSSAAHQLLGDLLNQLIPHIFGGGMRYGKRASDAMEKALQLDPQNVHALVSRAISYHYTPDSFGGGKTKAIEMLKTATEIDPNEDSPHIWLAMFYLEAKQNTEAMNAISTARKINPDRVFTNFIYKQILQAQKGKTGNTAPKE